MKKLLCMLLAAVLLCGAAFAEAVDYVGLWVLTGVEMGGMTMDPSMVGLTMDMDLRQDGACTLVIMGEAEEGVWSADANSVVVTDASGQPQTMTWTEGKLVASQDGMKLIFSRAGDAASFEGVWVMTGMVANGVEMGVDTMSMFGLTLTLTLNADGTCVVDGMGQKESGTWQATANGVAITDPTETLEFAYVDEMLVTEQGGAKMMLTREGAAPAIVEAAEAAVLTGVPAEAFEGKWELATAVVFGMELTADDMGTYLNLDLKAGAGIYTESDAAGEALELPVTYTVTEAETGTVLALLYQDATMAEPVELLQLNMLDDGRLVCVMNVDGMEVSYYFAPVVEEIPVE